VSYVELFLLSNTSFA